MIGTITYSFRSDSGASQAEPLLKMVVDSGISHIELMPPAAENYAGSPAAAQGRGGGARGGSGGGRGGGAGGGGRGPAYVAGSPLPVCPVGNIEAAVAEEREAVVAGRVVAAEEVAAVAADRTRNGWPLRKNSKSGDYPSLWISSKHSGKCTMTPA